jgi:hypothetical protein
VRLEGLRQLKNLVILLGIEPATFQLVVYCLDQLRYRVPPVMLILVIVNKIQVNFHVRGIL